MNFDEAVQYFDGLLRFGIKLGNERFEALLARLGSPHLSLDAVHIAGTKGKGSTATFASSILRAAGQKVGTYLSPYVYDLRERVQIDGEMIPKEEFARLATQIRNESEALAEEQPELGPTTEFEFKTALGFLWFAEQNVDYAVIEVGLGGRLDATNVLPAPLVSVITNIGLDHTAILGETLALIAGEKAGIIKPGGVCVTGAQSSEALTVIRSVCAERGAKLVEVAPGRDWGEVIQAGGRKADESELRLWVGTPKRRLHGVLLGVRGEFQHANAALAANALDCARVPIAGLTDEAFRRGFAAARIPGRLEIVRSEAPAILVDAAHNAMAAEALSGALRSGFRAGDRPLIFVVGMSKGHEPAEFLDALLSPFDRARLTLIATEPSFRPREAAEVADVARALGVGTVEIAPNAPAAARRALAVAQETAEHAPLIVVTGSFFTLGDLPPREWQAIFEERGLNVAIPANLLLDEVVR